LKSRVRCEERHDIVEILAGASRVGIPDQFLYRFSICHRNLPKKVPSSLQVRRARAANPDYIT